MTLHHIGYLVKNIDKSVKEMEFLGYHQISNIIYDEYRGIDICFIENNGYVIELIESKSEKSDVSKLFHKIGVSPYHICFTGSKY